MQVTKDVHDTELELQRRFGYSKSTTIQICGRNNITLGVSIGGTLAELDNTYSEKIKAVAEVSVRLSEKKAIVDANQNASSEIKTKLYQEFETVVQQLENANAVLDKFNRENPDYLYKDREDYIISRAITDFQNGTITSATVSTNLGSLHNFKDNISAHNEGPSPVKIALIVITPEHYIENEPTLQK